MSATEVVAPTTPPVITPRAARLLVQILQATVPADAEREERRHAA